MSNSSAAPADKPKGVVGSLAHGLNIIMAFSKAHPRMTLSQVSEKTGMDRAGARRYLLTLVHLGFVVQDGRLFQLTPKVLELGYSYLSSVPLTDKAQYYLDRIRDQTGFPVALGVRDELYVVHLASANSDEFNSPGLTIGRRFPIAYASAGRCILAMMEKAEREALLKDIKLEPMSDMSVATISALNKQLQIIRKQGYALVDQEMQTGIRSLAVPVFNARGQIAASFNTFTFSNLVPAAQLISDALPVMQAAAEELQATLI
ncbi:MULTISPECIES: IclR family transcriptional regulator domain-containing protein [Acetobacter]|uniref:Helix-turn-helix domain-containing protein n=1 Tax=Acetobacter thailandicus TaxID=1502842 RepID=A0ABT3QCZ3_9PROT|nr:MULTISPECIES: IclR family transcriptional regulator C-terminal domain-containing protein [Acetobacter]MCX2563183.1 helix-turn-helix domain-containing protein [Acetobacter thailandicus]OUI88296.1 IclR family transcriptional regulator [Acetobacter sp. DmW_043]